MKAAVVWLRRDLRLDDHPALEAALSTELPIMFAYCHDRPADKSWSSGAASDWWLHQSLNSFISELDSMGSSLHLIRGRAAEEISKLCKDLNACLFFNRHYNPSECEAERALESQLEKDLVPFQSFRGNLLYEPGSVKTQEGDTYKVYSPFWRACIKNSEPPAPIDKPKKLPSTPKPKKKSLKLDELKLLPNKNWYGSMEEYWTPGVDGARERLMKFSKSGFKDYSKDRDYPSIQGTSELSPHLHFGEISVRRIWHYLRKKIKKSEVEKCQYLKELAWRDFAYHLLEAFPHLADSPLRPEFKDFPWKQNKKLFDIWKKGLTGYPIVDAGMRQLWDIGWMHNRVRMIVASFLVKDLLIPWEDGAEWFWDTLVDADLASNTLGWQWAAGCGADAAPYFRVFNPTLQGKKYDPDGDYVRRWVPELQNLSKEFIHEPWKCTGDSAKKFKFEIGKDYPEPIVDHSEARKRALEAYDKVK